MLGFNYVVNCAPKLYNCWFRTPVSARSYRASVSLLDFLSYFSVKRMNSVNSFIHLRGLECKLYVCCSADSAATECYTDRGELDVRDSGDGHVAERRVSRGVVRRVSAGAGRRSLAHGREQHSRQQRQYRIPHSWSTVACTTTDVTERSIIRPRRIYEVRTTAIDGLGACQSVYHAGGLCKMAQQDDILFGMETLADSRNLVLDGRFIFPTARGTGFVTAFTKVLWLPVFICTETVSNATCNIH